MSLLAKTPAPHGVDDPVCRREVRVHEKLLLVEQREVAPGEAERSDASRRSAAEGHASASVRDEPCVELVVRLRRHELYVRRNGLTQAHGPRVRHGLPESEGRRDAARRGLRCLAPDPWLFAHAEQVGKHHAGEHGEADDHDREVDRERGEGEHDDERRGACGRAHVNAG
jgi:hypothetical protein